MSKAKNKVIAGDYYNYKVSANVGTVSISLLLVETINIDSKTVKSYEVITDEHRKSVISGTARGLVGKMLVGDVGMIAGALSAKEKGVYQIAVEFRNGKRSLLEVDDRIYKLIIKNCFASGFDDVSQNQAENNIIVSIPEPKQDVSKPKTTAKQKVSGCLVAVLVLVALIFVALLINTIPQLK